LGTTKNTIIAIINKGWESFKNTLHGRSEKKGLERGKKRGTLLK